jgi:CDP-diacylglycerol--glycerol-3-phosphate 3-phosphatidyltransferase
MFNQQVQRWVRAQAIRLIQPLVRAPISPNAVTTLGLLCAALVAWLAGAGHLLAAGVVLALSSITDIADGALARARDACTDYGAFFDSLLDRIAEAVIGLGILIYYVNHGHALEGSVLVYLGVCGALMVSYARARAEGLGLTCKVGFMARPERVVLTVAGLILSAPFGLWVLTLVLWILVITTFVTTAQRFWHVYQDTHAQERTPEQESTPVRPRLLRKRRIAS